MVPYLWRGVLKEEGETMPRGDGTGPAGRGAGTGRGMGGGGGGGGGMGKGKGGQGMGGGRRGAGPGGNCVCPSCGAAVPHQAGVPCFQVNCPQCNTAMVRQ